MAADATASSSNYVNVIFTVLIVVSLALINTSSANIVNAC